ncbi:hypothetical protein HRW09_02310 [Streptomyces lunaelactis]|uniref:hypothetical protein n=1 Tax=Streptomyces lunaelactis TaxID=1535768 RepID=UPI0015850322|nr:hypothetical protein [Streptomyces lunaelactis]NUL28420.1 hypothetical protein [Streptomyces lunaelactis]
MERAVILANRLKELREGRGWFEPFPLLPDDPLCVALWVHKRLPADRREDEFKGRLKYLIDNLDDETEREALLVAYNLHPDYKKGPSGSDLILNARRKRYAEKLGLKDDRTVRRREDSAIEKLAQKLALEPAAPPLVFGKRFTRKPHNVYLFGGRPMAKSHARLFGAALALTVLVVVLGVIIYIGAATGAFYIISPPK